LNKILNTCQVLLWASDMVQQTIKIIKIHYRLYIKAISPLKHYSSNITIMQPENIWTQHNFAMSFGQKTCFRNPVILYTIIRIYLGNKYIYRLISYHASVRTCIQES
jgi:hypothetical protein